MIQETNRVPRCAAGHASERPDVVWCGPEHYPTHTKQANTVGRGRRAQHADVAHLAEHDLAKVGVAGSTPVVRSTPFRCRKHNDTRERHSPPVNDDGS